jgi:hypothetical protein
MGNGVAKQCCINKATIGKLFRTMGNGVAKQCCINKATITANKRLEGRVFFEVRSEAFP